MYLCEIKSCQHLDDNWNLFSRCFLPRCLVRTASLLKRLLHSFSSQLVHGDGKFIISICNVSLNSELVGTLEHIYYWLCHDCYMRSLERLLEEIESIGLILEGMY